MLNFEDMPNGYTVTALLGLKRVDRVLQNGVASFGNWCANALLFTVWLVAAISLFPCWCLEKLAGDNE